MYNHNESNICDYDVEITAAEAHRLPQFNESYCGYRCGWGCCEPLNGRDSLSNGTPTLVEPSENERAPIGISASPQMDLQGSQVGASPSHEDIEASGHGIDLPANRFMLARGGSYASLRPSQYHSGSLESQENRSSSGSRSVLGFENGRHGTVSPGYLVRGAGDWDENNDADRFPPKYHFLATPLRLSPQFEHCRGHPVSHMVIQDELVLLDHIEEDWRRQALGIGRFLWPDTGISSR